MIRVAQFTDEHRAGLLRLYREGDTHAKLADRVGCSKTTIQRVLNTTPGYRPRPGRGGARKHPGITPRTVRLRARVRELIKTMSSDEVGEEMGITRQRVNQLLTDTREPTERENHAAKK